MDTQEYARNLLLNSFHAAIAAADPLRVVPRHLPPNPPNDRTPGRTLVVGAGKAAASMASAVENHWQEGARQDAALDGIVLTRYGHGLPLKRIHVVEAGHPLPDEHGEQATQTILREVQKLGSNDLMLCLLSGGGSSLLSLPVEGVSIHDLRSVTTELLRCGASIQEINTVRKHLSAVLGGRLAASCRAPVLALIISDVAGDDPTHIASGPCAPDPTTYSDALAVLDHYRINAPAAVMEALLAGAHGKIGETPKPGGAAFNRVENRVIASARGSLLAAREYFQHEGMPAVVLSDAITGEARDVAKVLAAVVKEVRLHGQPWEPPIALISGGETTVTVRRDGRGGRNAEFLLALAIELEGMENVFALACDTDGLDGTENNAGAIITPDSLSRAKRRGISAATLLAGNDAYTFFERLDDLIVTGPTRTNVNDYRAIIVL
ncbi:MAG TPA: glycerate kinase [Nitrosospira sp.]